MLKREEGVRMESIITNKSKDRSEFIMRSIISSQLSNYEYTADTCSVKSKEISDDIKNTLKKQYGNKYKIVVQVVIGEKKGEGIRMACRCLWDKYMDHLTKVEYNLKNDIFALATAFVFYVY